MKQTNFIKTQLRLRPDLHHAAMQYAEKNELSMNTAINTLMESGLKSIETPTKAPPDSTELLLLLQDLREARKEAREMRMLYMNSITKHLPNIANDFDSQLITAIRDLVKTFPEN